MSHLLKDSEITPVVFRVWPDTGDVLALFPFIDEGNGLCSSYEHLGQHGAADYTACILKTRQAAEHEYLRLHQELTEMGYALRVYVRRPSGMRHDS